MSQGQESIIKFITRTPHSIEPAQLLEEACRVMGRDDVHQLPVLAEGWIVEWCRSGTTSGVRLGLGPDPGPQSDRIFFLHRV